MLRETVQTRLRPDYYQYFPWLSEIEIAHRLRYLDAVDATLLDPVNLDALARLRPDAHSAVVATPEGLASVLRRVGVSHVVAAAVAGTPRLGLPARGELDTRYLNESYLVAEPYTWVSAPGVVALMIQQLLPFSGSTVLEVGIGSGYHAAALMRAAPRVQITGVEPNAAAISVAQRLLERAEVGDRARIVEGLVDDGLRASWDSIYVTAAVDWATLDWLASLSTKATAYLQAPRILTKAEFDSEPDWSWLSRTFGSYDNYCEGNWRSYVAVSLFRLANGRISSEVQRIFDFRFVPLLEEGSRRA